MDYTTLGRTEMKVSVAGLGCGGPSRLGLRSSRGEKGAIDLIRQAVEQGVNFFDTAESYGTEAVVGRALAEVPRNRVVLSTKKTLPPSSRWNPGSQIRKSLERSLKQLGTDYVDVYHLHGVEPEDYSYSRDKLLPALVKLREQGKIRAIGITEGFGPDPSHQMLAQAIRDDCWDVVMVGFNLLNPSARKNVFPAARERRVGVLNMFAVRRALSQPARFAEIVADLSRRGALGSDDASAAKLLESLTADGGASTLPEAAYRFCRHEPGVDVVLFGTGNADHLRENIKSLTKPPLPASVLDRLRVTFGEVDSVTGS